MFTKLKKWVTVIILVLCDLLFNCLVLRLAAANFESGWRLSDWIPVIYFSVVLMLSNGLMAGHIFNVVRKK